MRCINQPKGKNMTNQDYITINRNGIFVGGKQTTKYHDQTIIKTEFICKLFNIPGLEEISEIRVLQSDTYGTVFQPGEPKPSKTGHYIWIQAVTKYGVSPWIFRLDDTGRKDVAGLCAFQCAWTVAQYPNWVNKLLMAAKTSKDIIKATNSMVKTGISR